MLEAATCKDSINVIFSPESAAGQERYVSPNGQIVLMFGQEAAHASPLVRPASGKGPTTSGTCGPSSGASSPSARLQSLLASKLQARMGASGSPEFVLTWKSWDMQSGPPICALRARARMAKDGLCIRAELLSESESSSAPLTSDSAFGGWPTPTSLSFAESHAPGNNQSMNRTVALLAGWTSPRASEIGRQRTPEAIARAQEKGGSSSLEDQVHLASWATPRKTDGEKGIRSSEGAIAEFKRKGTGADLPTVASLASWATPSHRDFKSEEASDEFNAERDAHSRGKPLSYQAVGLPSLSSHAPTANRGVLNPALSRWLQGYQSAWDEAAPNWSEWQSVQRELTEQDA